MFTIDSHTHIIPEKIPGYAAKFGYGEFITLDHHTPGKAWMVRGSKRFREISENCWNPDVRIREMEKHRVDMQVLSTIPVMFSYWAKAEHAEETSIFLNDHIAEIVNRYPGKFAGLGTIPLQDEKRA